MKAEALRAATAVAVCSSLAFTPAMLAAQQGVAEGAPATPSYRGDTGLFHLPSAYVLPRGRTSFGVFRDNIDRDPKDLDVSLHGVTLAIGAGERLEAFATAALQVRVDADALAQPGYFTGLPFVSTGWQTGLGDLWLGAKLQLLDDRTGDLLALAVSGRLKFPSPNAERGLGTGRPSADADLILSRALARKASLHAATGLELNARPERVSVADALKLGAGLEWRPSPRLCTQMELTGTIYTSGAPDQTDPLDLVLGAVAFSRRGAFLRFAVSRNLAFDDRGLGSSAKSKTGLHASLGFHPGLSAPAAPPSNRPPTVTCYSERPTLRAGESVGLAAAASDSDGDPLAYEWSATQGRVSGTSLVASFHSAGVEAPTSVRVRVRVSDGRGGVAESACRLEVEPAGLGFDPP